MADDNTVFGVMAAALIVVIVILASKTGVGMQSIFDTSSVKSFVSATSGQVVLMVFVVLAVVAFFIPKKS